MIEIEAGGPLEQASADVLGVPVLAERQFTAGGRWVAERLGDWLDGYLDEADFTGKEGQLISCPSGGRIPFGTVVLVGLGEDLDTEAVRRAAGSLGRASSRATTVATTLHELEVVDAVEAVASGFLLGQYRFEKYQTEPKPFKTERLLLIEVDQAALVSARRGRTIAEAVGLARDLVNEPSAGKAPEELAGIARGIGDRHGLRVRVYDDEEIRSEGFGGLAGVGAGADNPPRMVELWYEPAEPRGFLALVGKGIVFDAGGLSIKSASAMEKMKTDMSGAAVVFAAMQAIADLELPVKVMGVTPLTENMPGGGALHPGDVLRARNGKTIEVLNTDAEGRLVLADGLSLVAEARPDFILDVATLTGACHVALGDKIAGLWGSDDEARATVTAAAETAGERVWEMPLPADYRKQIDSEIADMKNISSSRYGGAITAALLLKEFVGDLPWAHLDIAGPALADESEHYLSKG
ncbi:MAG: leucyl aminopeptidase, partial [Acidimicrobiia bacterium]